MNLALSLEMLEEDWPVVCNKNFLQELFCCFLVARRISLEGLRVQLGDNFMLLKHIYHYGDRTLGFGVVLV